MQRLPAVGPRSGRLLIALLLGIKLLLLLWNAIVFDGKSYDASYHADRAVFAGLRPSSTTHDGPLYYLVAGLVPRSDEVPRISRATTGEEGELDTAAPTKPPRQGREEKAFRAELLDVLRYTNVLWVGAFYLLWIYWLFPRLLPGFRAWFLASLLLLALPGYQKLGAMSHPDNLLLASSAAALGCWLFMRDRWLRAGTRVVPWRHLLGFALSIGLLAASRWSAIALVAVLAVLCVVYAVRSSAGRLLALAPRLLASGALIGLLGFSWYGYVRASAAGREPATQVSYFPRYNQDRSGFDYAAYYASFRVGQLLGLGDAPEASAPSSMANSFFTLLYSDTWGDEWRAFSSSRAKGAKNTPIRALLGAALPLLPIGFGLIALGVASLVRRIRAGDEPPAESATPGSLPRLVELEPALVVLAIVALGAAVFMYWQGKPGLFPGDNSTVKFSYVAWLFPPVIALMFTRELRPSVFSLLTGYIFALYVLAFPVAMYWPA